ncbi:hypothetical protein JIN85_02910 [Luteolibacter pohnpeiensis]|uniref:Glycoside hydrolase family 42 N-terminal domain-containing protein n=1 Tax=Luteolibacter pohnpeiensis TaxID=454153 RepID=A0A934VV23_9BACT|nr:hypothetical protein [Luteolibacter pohnpeiensis]MBK1881348.1 hypothetical protein [Luteolibacter pohnpeiensis]
MNPTTPLLPSFALFLALATSSPAQQLPPPFPNDPASALERTCFQTSRPWSPLGNLRSDVTLVYGIDKSLPERINTWRDRGYRVHLMTGVAWGEYQDYLYGRFDGKNHVDNAQTNRKGETISHGGDVYYMCPAENYGEFLSVGVQKGLEAGVEAVHLEEPEFWARAGYSEGFKREWKAFYQEDWQAPDSSPDAQWRASKLKYYLYRRALQQVFNHVQEFNKKNNKHVRCYVPTHSLLNYAHWCIVSPQSSLAKLDGCDGYIAQVWTGTSRTPNPFRGKLKERTLETAFLEYGAMQNLVRATGRSVWYLNDPIEDNPRHDWTDYRTNWESTLVASLLQPDVSQFEVAPWPERIFGEKYPKGGSEADRKSIPPEYATELQVVMNALNDMKQPDYAWDAGTRGIGILISDSLMFQREQPTPSDPNMAQFYGLAMPPLKRGIPITPVQLENVTLPGFLDDQKVLMLSYQGQKPQSADIHPALAEWVKKGGILIFVDDDSDPYNKVREWWNDEGKNDRIPRQDLFEKLGLKREPTPDRATKVGNGSLIWLKKNPVSYALSEEGDLALIDALKKAAHKADLDWTETNHLLLRRGPYWVGAGLDESISEDSKILSGRLINLFDPELKVQKSFTLAPGNRVFLLDLDKLVLPKTPTVIASACKALPLKNESREFSWTVEGVGNTPGIVLVSSSIAPKSIQLGDQDVKDFTWDEENHLLHVRFENEATPRVLKMNF